MSIPSIITSLLDELVKLILLSIGFELDNVNTPSLKKLVPILNFLFVAMVTLSLSIVAPPTVNVLPELIVTLSLTVVAPPTVNVLPELIVTLSLSIVEPPTFNVLPELIVTLSLSVVAPPTNNVLPEAMEILSINVVGPKKLLFPFTVMVSILQFLQDKLPFPIPVVVTSPIAT